MFPSADDYDTPWKEAVSRHFPEFMAFYFPQAHAAIDWGRPHLFLDKELAQVVQDAELGRRLADRLVQVATLSGAQEWVLVHIEIQGGRDSGFAERISARGAAKWRLARLLYQRNWDKQRTIDLFAVIDWMMRLPADLEAELWRDIQEWERSDSMPYVTSVERIGLERGRKEGESMMLARLLSKRFGPLPETIKNRLAEASIPQLEAWSEIMLDASSLEEVFREQ